jgi:predicted NAD/FAD-binding protein
MKIAVVGAGISGMVAALELSRHHEVDVYEAGDYPGGHTDTHHIQIQGAHYHVDSGFIVYNEANYPRFCAFLDELKVAGRDTEMSFSVSNPGSGLEYNPASFSRLFCQRRNLVSPRFYHMLWDLLRFYRQAPALLQQEDDQLTLGDYLREQGFGQAFINDHLLPMACALWSGPSVSLASFPARYFVQFMHNHRMLNLTNRPTWRTIEGGSQRYVDAWVAKFPGQLFCRSAVELVLPSDTPEAGIRLRVHDHWYDYDRVFLACHADQALKLLANPDASQVAILGSMAFQQNHMQLHTDTRVLPRHPSAWASWNVRVSDELGQQCTVSYDMNILQGLKAPVEFIVSLNSSQWVDPAKVLSERYYQHPVYTPESLAAQKRWQEINGRHCLYYCGAYWGWGFHEDGVVSARRAVAAFETHHREKSHAA